MFLILAAYGIIMALVGAAVMIAWVGLDQGWF